MANFLKYFDGQDPHQIRLRNPHSACAPVRVTNRSHSTYGSKLKFLLSEYFNFLFAYLVITYYFLQFLSDGDRKKVLQYLFLPSRSIQYSKIVSCPPQHLTYTLVMGGANPYMDLNAKYEKRYYDVLLRLIQIRISPKQGKCT